MDNLVLGIDLGPTSIGWALIKADQSSETGNLAAGRSGKK